MYIQPFWFGVICTIFAEIGAAFLIFLAAVMKKVRQTKQYGQ